MVAVATSACGEHRRSFALPLYRRGRRPRRPALERCLDIGVDVVRTAVDIAQHPRTGEDARTVRDAEPDPGRTPLFAPEQIADVHIDRRIEIVDQPGQVAVALFQADALGIRNAL